MNIKNDIYQSPELEIEQITVANRFCDWDDCDENNEPCIGSIGDPIWD